MSDERPLIIKRKKVSGGDGHHGGAWKVAYADFVTAMMAFFLLMWLLNATSEEQRKGLADFFDPSIPVSRASAGGAGMLNGESIHTEKRSSGTTPVGERPKPTRRDPGDDFGPDAASPETAGGENEGASGGTDDEDRELGAVADDLLAKVKAAGGDGLLEHFNMRVTPEGLVIEIADIHNEPLFGSGSARPAAVLSELMEILVPVLGRTTNAIAVAGHTDARPFASRNNYSNWELSADRANTARRLMIEQGLDTDRITRVSGRAASDPIVADPFAARNRRIAVILLRETSER